MPDPRISFGIKEKPEKLSDCISPWDIARLLGTEYSILSKIIYPSPSKNYSTFSIPKKSGNVRVINAPKLHLMDLQLKAASLLKLYYKPMAISHGFIEGRSIKTNAIIHVGKRYVFNIDLEDFFGTIHFGRIKQLFTKPPFALSNASATVLAQLCCLDNKLPQGAPTSPILTNMICLGLDRELLKLAKEYQCHVTRYVDDITFSFTCKDKNLPKAIVFTSAEADVVVGDKLQKIIKRQGFKINGSKTRIKPQHQKQEVTGLVVNEKVNVKRTFIQQTKSMLYAWEKYGLDDAANHHISIHKKKDMAGRYRKTNSDYFNQMVRGRINFIRMIKGVNDPIYKMLAYRYLKLVGKPNKNLLKDELSKIVDSIFVIENEEAITCGTGFVLENHGLVTNFHVVKLEDFSKLEELKVFRHDNPDAHLPLTKCLKTLQNIDIAVFEMTKQDSEFTPLKVGNSDKVNKHSIVTIIGYPDYNKGDDPRIIKAEVIGKKTYLGVYIYLVDKNIFHGNSGGPVFNENMEVVGIATNGGEAAAGGTSINGFIPIRSLLEYS